MVLHKVNVSIGPCGRGIYASEAINEGDVVWEIGAEDILRNPTRDEIANWPNEEERSKLIMYSYMIGEDVFSTTTNPDEDPSWYFNHTCNPNTGYVDEDHLVALRRIEPGEHVAYDYAFTENEKSFHSGMKCLCGSSNCRGTFTGEEHKNPEWRAKWLQYSLPHIKNRPLN